MSTRYAARGEPVRFRSDGDLYAACLYRPFLPEPQPGVLVVHAAQELDNQVKGLAERLAHVGYVTLALDAQPGEWETSHASTPAGAGAEPVLRAAVGWLRGQKYVRGRLVGALGVGRGGLLAVQLATGAHPVQAAVSIYGELEAFVRRAAEVLAPLLIIEAGDGPDSIGGLLPTRAARSGARAEPGAAQNAQHESVGSVPSPHEFARYPQAKRGFFDERSPDFRPDDAEDAWSRANKFFYKQLGVPG